MTRADSGVIPYSDDDASDFVRMWGREPTDSEWMLLMKRVEILRWLKSLYQDLELQSQFYDSRWTKLYRFGDTKMYAPAVYYRILPNEIVFDVDSDSGIDQALEATKTIVKNLRVLGCTPAVGFSGRRGFHVHVLYSSIEDVSRFIRVLSQAPDQASELKQAFFDFLLDFMPEVRDLVDTGVVTAKAHSIRAFLSLNLKSMRWKKFVRPFTKYTVWFVGNGLVDRLVREIEKKELFREVDELLKSEDEVKSKRSKGERIMQVSEEEIIQAVLKELKNVKDCGLYYKASCPFHPPDVHPSLTIYKPARGFKRYCVIDWHTGERMSLSAFYSKLKHKNRE